MLGAFTVHELGTQKVLRTNEQTDREDPLLDLL